MKNILNIGVISLIVGLSCGCATTTTATSVPVPKRESNVSLNHTPDSSNERRYWRGELPIPDGYTHWVPPVDKSGDKRPDPVVVGLPEIIRSKPAAKNDEGGFDISGGLIASAGSGVGDVSGQSYGSGTSNNPPIDSNNMIGHLLRQQEFKNKPKSNYQCNHCRLIQPAGVNRFFDAEDEPAMKDGCPKNPELGTHWWQKI